MDTLPLLPETASTMADKYEWLFWFVVVITGAATVAVFGLIMYFCVRYRRSTSTGPCPRILGSHKLELGWTIIPLFIFLVFFGWGVHIYDQVMHPPADALQVNVIGKQWMWKAQYETGQRVIIGGNPANAADREGNKSIGKLVLPINRDVRVSLISEDVIHDFGVPAFRTKIDVLPGRYTTTWYHPNKIGEYHIFCDQYCGTLHSLMVGTVAVVSQADFDGWLEGRVILPGVEFAVDGSMAWEGGKLFQKLQCNSCHTNKTDGRAPVLEGLYNTRVPLAGGDSVLADDQYIIESILNPQAKIVEGWRVPSIMPGDYQKQISAEDLNRLVAYIKSLKAGSSMPRNEHFPPPVGAEPRSESEKDKK